MYSNTGGTLGADAVTVTWCSCERCLAVGPRTMTLTKMGRERVISLHTDCCRTTACDPMQGDD
jgi:hypothetical protein